jgi:hypothetical protein
MDTGSIYCKYTQMYTKMPHAYIHRIHKITNTQIKHIIHTSQSIQIYERRTRGKDANHYTTDAVLRYFDLKSLY